MPTHADAIDAAITEFARGIVDALPQLLGGLIFLVLAYLVIRVVTGTLRAILERAYPAEQRLIARLVVLIVTIFLWFGAGLALMNIVGLGELAASLGTAVGFLALGVSYALSEMIKDTVAGVYLLRDPDFNPGDTVTTGDTTGTVIEIGLRKSRLRLDNGDRMILANREVEEAWTKRTDN